MYCEKCGSPVINGSNFCNACGNQLNQDLYNPLRSTNSLMTDQVLPKAVNASLAASAPVVSAAARTATSAMSAKVFATVLVTALIGAGIFLYNMFFVIQPIDIVDKFVQAINEKDLNTAISCMDPTTERTYNAASGIITGFIGVELTDLADLLPGLLELSECPVDLQMEITDVVSETIDGDDATVVVTIKALQTDENGIQTTDGGNSIFRLHKFNDGWRITSFE